MGKIYMIGAMKGGVGKSVSVFNLAYSLQKRGKKVGNRGVDVGQGHEQLAGKEGEHGHVDAQHIIVLMPAHAAGKNIEDLIVGIDPDMDGHAGLVGVQLGDVLERVGLGAVQRDDAQRLSVGMRNGRRGE